MQAATWNSSKNTKMEGLDEDYLEKTHVMEHLHTVMHQLLVTRTDQPIDMIAEYFNNLDQDALSPIAIYNFVKAEANEKDSCMELLATVYKKMCRDTMNENMGRVVFMHLLKQLCFEMDPLYRDPLLKFVEPPLDGDVISFERFIISIRICVLHSELIGLIDAIFSDPGQHNDRDARVLYEYILKNEGSDATKSKGTALMKKALESVVSKQTGSADMSKVDQVVNVTYDEMIRSLLQQTIGFMKEN